VDELLARTLHCVWLDPGTSDDDNSPFPQSTQVMQAARLLVDACAAAATLRAQGVAGPAGGGAASASGALHPAAVLVPAFSVCVTPRQYEEPLVAEIGRFVGELREAGLRASLHQHLFDQEASLLNHFRVLHEFELSMPGLPLAPPPLLPPPPPPPPPQGLPIGAAGSADAAAQLGTQ